VPLAPLLMVSHDALLVALQAQVLPVVTPTLVVSPAAGELRVAGEIEGVQGAAPACVTEKVCPAIVTVPVRCEVLVFAATATFAVPLPFPLAPLLMVSHDALLAAIQAQVLPVVTLTLVVSPAAGELRVVGVIENAQGAAWVTEKVCPAIVIVPVRCAPLFAATATFTVPLPVPLAPLLMVSHDALVVAFHAHVLPVVTLTLAASPPAGELRVVGEIA
jgi:hypothetical protein